MKFELQAWLYSETLYCNSSTKDNSISNNYPFNSSESFIRPYTFSRIYYSSCFYYSSYIKYLSNSLIITFFFLSKSFNNYIVYCYLNCSLYLKASKNNFLFFKKSNKYLLDMIIVYYLIFLHFLVIYFNNLFLNFNNSISNCLLETIFN